MICIINFNKIYAKVVENHWRKRDKMMNIHLVEKKSCLGLFTKKVNRKRVLQAQAAQEKAKLLKRRRKKAYGVSGWMWWICMNGFFFFNNDMQLGSLLKKMVESAFLRQWILGNSSYLLFNYLLSVRLNGNWIFKTNSSLYFHSYN